MRISDWSSDVCSSDFGFGENIVAEIACAQLQHAMPPISAQQPRCWEGPPVIRIFGLGAKTNAVGGLVRVFHSKVHGRQFPRRNAGLPCQAPSERCTFQVAADQPDAKADLLRQPSPEE